MANLEQLQAKYQPAIDFAKTRNVSWKHVHMEGEKLFIQGAAPSDAVKNEVWDRIKAIDAAYGDLTADIAVDASLPAPPPPAAATRTYAVKSGDTLSKIAKQFYGDAMKYRVIFDANRDILKDPDHISPGQELKIPA